MQFGQIFVSNYVSPEIYLQVETGYNLISATIPCLQIFLRAAQFGMLGEVPGSNVVDTQLATVGSNSLNLSKSRTKRSKGRDHTIELTSRNYGHTVIGAATGGEKISWASDSSENGIVVRQTVDVQYDQDAIELTRF